MGILIRLFCRVKGMAHNVSICVRAGLSKPRPVPDTERIKDTKTLDCASTPLDANTLLVAVPILKVHYTLSSRPLFRHTEKADQSNNLVLLILPLSCRKIPYRHAVHNAVQNVLDPGCNVRVQKTSCCQ